MRMDVFAALADPVRRSLLEQLADDGPARVVDLTDGRGISRPAVSRHLRVLREAGLVSVHEAGRERHYALDDAPLAAVGALVDGLRGRGRRHIPPVAESALDALELEVRRTGRDRRAATGTSSRTTDAGHHDTGHHDTEESA